MVDMFIQQKSWSPKSLGVCFGKTVASSLCSSTVCISELHADKHTQTWATSCHWFVYTITSATLLRPLCVKLRLGLDQITFCGDKTVFRCQSDFLWFYCGGCCCRLVWCSEVLPSLANGSPLVGITLRLPVSCLSDLIATQHSKQLNITQWILLY